MYANLPDRSQNMYNKFGIKKTGSNYSSYNDVRIDLPSRFLVTGKTSSGKTSLMLDLIERIGCWNKIWLVAKDSSEPLYAHFIDLIREQEAKLSQMKTMKKYKNYSIDDNILTVLDNPMELPDVNDLNKDDNNLIIFDDQMCETPKVLKYCTEYFSRGRKRNCSVFFLAQSVIAAPKNLRRNCNIQIIKDMTNNSDIETMSKEYAIGITPEQLKWAIRECIDDKQSCLLLDFENPEKSLRIRKFLKPLALPDV